MVKLTLKKGRWKKEGFDREMIFECCSKCKGKELHFPVYMTDVNCPDCKTDLIGGKLIKPQQRKEWHLAI
jgi:hypothetical protein